jgi:hypothetical protein
MMVWVNSNIRFVHSFHPSRAAHSLLRDVFHPMHSLAAWAAFSASAFYHLHSSSPSTPSRSFISGAFTSTGDSSVSTTTSISDDSFRDYKQTDGGPVTSTPNSQKSKSRGDDVDVRVGWGLVVRSERFSARLPRAKPGYKPTREPGRRKLPPNRFPRPPPEEPALTATPVVLGSS